jgi:hypothetical protein
MSLFSKLFCEKQDPLLEQAERLVPAAQLHAITIFTPLIDKFPLLRQVNVDNWDFFLTIAGVLMAATRLNNLRLGPSREEKLMGVVAERLNQWKPDGIRGFEDCKAFFERTFDGLTRARNDPRFIASDAIGSWIVWNIFGHPTNSEEERMLVRTTGAMVTHAFFDWWS